MLINLFHKTLARYSQLHRSNLIETTIIFENYCLLALEAHGLEGYVYGTSIAPSEFFIVEQDEDPPMQSYLHYGCV